jgi:signal transduction histidine kinase
MNLLANAIDALEEKYQTEDEQLKQKRDKTLEPPTIWIGTESIDDRGVIIRIADNGAGIEPEICDRLFEPMFTTKPRGKGTGLGLSISRQIVEERHGGSLTCHSIPGEGSEFAIAIPIEDLE